LHKHQTRLKPTLITTTPELAAMSDLDAAVSGARVEVPDGICAVRIRDTGLSLAMPIPDLGFLGAVVLALVLLAATALTYRWGPGLRDR
jgi:hypothetical protein